MSDEELMRSILGGAPSPSHKLVTPRLVTPPRRTLLGAGLNAGKGDPNTFVSRRLIVDDGGVGLGQIENLRAEGPFKDEVQDYLEKKEEAAKGPNGESLDEFYQRVQQQQNTRDELAKIAPFTRQNPPTVVGASLSGQTSVVSGGPTATLAFWAGDDEEGTAVTVSIYPVLQVQAIDATLGKGAWRPFAWVTIGLRGAKQTIAVDIGTGVQFTVSASLVQVDVGMDPVVAGAMVKNGATLGAHLAFKSVTRQKPVTRTSYVDAIGAAATKRIFVPLFARDVTVYSTNAAPTLNFLDIAGNTVFSLTPVKGVATGVLSNDIVAVDYVDAGGGGDGRVVWGLAL